MALDEPAGYDNLMLEKVRHDSIGIFDFDDLEDSLPVSSEVKSAELFDFDGLEDSLSVSSEVNLSSVKLHEGLDKFSEHNIVRNVRAHAVSAAAHVVLLDQEGQWADDEALRKLSTHFTAEGWMYTSQVGVPPQCLSRVQLEVSLLDSCKKTRQKTGGGWTLPVTNHTDRTDNVLFIDSQNLTKLRKHFNGLAKLDQIVERVVCQFAAILGTSSGELLMHGRTKMMLERFQPGGYNARHMAFDEAEGDNAVLTAIYYLNADWEPKDGGALRLWPKRGSSPVEIWPKDDTFVVFRADQVMQEVCVSRKKRFALTISFTGLRDASCESTTGFWAGMLPLRKAPTSVTGGMQMFQLHKGCLTTDRQVTSSDSDSEQHDESEEALKMPLLVCCNIVGFSREQGIQKFAGLFVEAAKLGIKDRIMLSFPEDYGIKDKGTSEPWARYVDAMVEDIDKKARGSTQPLIIIAHGLGAAPALTLATRLDTRLRKIYLIDGIPPYTYESQNAVMVRMSDADWVRFLSTLNPGSSVLRVMAQALESDAWDVAKSSGAQSIIEHGQRMYVNAIYPDLKRDLKKLAAPILAFSMTKDNVVPLEDLQMFQDYTLGRLQIMMVDNFHMGWLEPTEHLQTSVRRINVFKRICEDISKHLESWVPRAVAEEGNRSSPLQSGFSLDPNTVQSSDDILMSLEATPESNAIERCLHPGEKCSGNISDPLRIRCTGFARGRLVLDVSVCKKWKDASRLILFAFPGNANDDFRWVSEMSPAGAVGWQCQIQTHRWFFTSPDITVLPLLMSEAPKPSEEALKFTGVGFKPLFQNVEFAGSVSAPVSNAMSFQASLVFIAEEDSMPSAELRLAHSVFHKVFRDIDGMKLSAEELLKDIQLTYGEVHFSPFWNVMQRFATPRPGETFVDLGSGTGRAVVAMALGFPELQRCIGLEIVASLHSAAVQAAGSLAEAACPAAAVEFQEVNFLEVSWEADVDIVWVSSLCMGEATLHEIARRTALLKKGSRILTMDSKFGEGIDGLEKVLLDGKEFVTIEMSFGEGRVYAVQRT